MDKPRPKYEYRDMGHMRMPILTRKRVGETRAGKLPPEVEAVLDGRAYAITLRELDARPGAAAGDLAAEEPATTDERASVHADR
jgi:hypothetical protein